MRLLIRDRSWLGKDPCVRECYFSYEDKAMGTRITLSQLDAAAPESSYLLGDKPVSQSALSQTLVGHSVIVVLCVCVCSLVSNFISRHLRGLPPRRCRCDLVASYNKPRRLMAAKKFLVSLPAGGLCATWAKIRNYTQFHATNKYRWRQYTEYWQVLNRHLTNCTFQVKTE